MNMNQRWLLSLAATAALAAHARASDPAPTNVPDPVLRALHQTTLLLLKEGNARFAAGHPQHPNQTPQRRTATALEGQEPLATVLACSDSREPVELIFDRGIGELFVVRVAGNTVDTDQLATMEYGVAHLHTPVLVVAGHTKCGAVTAVVKGAELHGHLPQLAAKIKPAAARAKAAGGTEAEIITEAIRANVWQSIADILRRSDVIRQQLQAGSVQIVGAVYDLESGAVDWLGPHPEQAALLVQAAANIPALGHLPPTGDVGPAPPSLPPSATPKAAVEKKH